MDEPVARDPGPIKDAVVGGSGSGGSGGPGSGKPPKAKRAPLTAIACVACRKRKSRCDGARPLCETCNQKGTPCFYDMDIGDRSQIQLRAKIDTVTSDRENFRDILFWLSDMFAPEVASTVKSIVGLDDGLRRDAVEQIKNLVLNTYPYLIVRGQQHQQQQQQQQQRQEEQQRAQQISPSGQQTSYSSYPPNPQWQYGSYTNMPVPYQTPQSDPVSPVYYQTQGMAGPSNTSGAMTYQQMVPQSYMPTQVPMGPFQLPPPQPYTSIYASADGLHPPGSMANYRPERVEPFKREEQQQPPEPEESAEDRND